MLINPYPFAPIPSASNRHDGWTEQRQTIFIAHLARFGIVSAAAKAAGMSPKSAYNLRNRAVRLGAAGESFVRAWDAALSRGQAIALDTAIDRGLNGVATPYFYRGIQRGVKVRPDNRLLMAALRALDRKADKVGR